ncbi:MAG: sigma-70 family RNA polymerase sigma factor [Phycisphaerae bacterium]|nr:sigma-70 family RNA polymerase sigma factor [Phycisphaerae bacterium]
MVHTKAPAKSASGRHPGSNEPEARPLWYAANAMIRTKAACEDTIRLADRICSTELGPVPDEQELFIALHTAAYQASRPVNQRRSARLEREAWTERWEAIREFIVEQNLGLVYSMIGRFGSRHMDEDDLQSEAMFALSRAVDRFNPWRGYKFSTYACNVIARALMRRGKQETHYRRLFPVQHDLSFERPEGMPDLDAGLYVERLQRVLDRNLGELTDLETQILSHRFPPEEESRLTFQEIGEVIGLSKERVRQIQNIALIKLRGVLDLDPVLQ